MKRILITGIYSYIGKSLVGYLEKYNAGLEETAYQVTCIQQRTGGWEKQDFSDYDVVLDVTGISQVDHKKLSKEQEKKYYEINAGLAYKTAQKAKKEGVKQFIFLSSILVYGEAASITPDTPPAPISVYGKSKWLAEEKLKELEEQKFRVAIVRLPLVYGPDAGNGYRLLSRWAGKLPIIPTISEAKSMIYIENLCEFLRLLIEAKAGGVYFPQNATPVSTMGMLEEIRRARGKKTYKCSILNPGIKLFTRMPGRCGKIARKVFVGQAYEMCMSAGLGDYQLVDFSESIQRIEG